MDRITNQISIDKSLVTKALIAKLQKHYPNLECLIGESSSQAIFSVDSMPKHEIELVRLDLQFYAQNPNLPLENVCSHLENYQPQNESQREMLKYANQLIAFKDESLGAGLYMFGEAGIGKSHIAIGISKEFMRRGLSPNFQIADQYRYTQTITLAPAQVWVIDDMNSGFHLSSRLFKEVVLNAHHKGGRVFVTSNKNYDELMTELFVGDGKANKMRYEDRTKGMFKILHVAGDSYRQANAWYV